MNGGLGQVKMSFWVYILKCSDESYYTGHTDNLEKRLGEHQQGLVKSYTSTRLSVELMFSKECSTREEALTAEQQIKGWSRKKKEALMRGDWAEIRRLSCLKSIHPSTVRQAHDSGRTDFIKHVE
ncbi:MAG: GIY-YIG nuclease family protein [Stenotrophobium sp.]